MLDSGAKRVSTLRPAWKTDFKRTKGGRNSKRSQAFCDALNEMPFTFGGHLNTWSPVGSPMGRFSECGFAGGWPVRFQKS